MTKHDSKKADELIKGDMPLFTRTVDDEVSKLKSELVELRKKNAELEQVARLAKLSVATEVSSHIESPSSAKEISVKVDKIQAYYYKQAKQLKGGNL